MKTVCATKVMVKRIPKKWNGKKWIKSWHRKIRLSWSPHMEATKQSKSLLSLFDLTMIVIGLVIGMGIFRTASARRLRGWKGKRFKSARLEILRKRSANWNPETRAGCTTGLAAPQMTTRAQLWFNACSYQDKTLWRDSPSVPYFWACSQ